MALCTDVAHLVVHVPDAFGDVFQLAASQTWQTTSGTTTLGRLQDEKRARARAHDLHGHRGFSRRQPPRRQPTFLSLLLMGLSITARTPMVSWPSWGWYLRVARVPMLPRPRGVTLTCIASTAGPTRGRRPSLRCAFAAFVGLITCCGFPILHQLMPQLVSLLVTLHP